MDGDAPPAAPPAPFAAQPARPPPPPDALRCPITLHLLRDPVVTAHGHTYEREAIEAAWSATPAGTEKRDPLSNEPVASPEVTTSWAVRAHGACCLITRAASTARSLLPEGGSLLSDVTFSQGHVSVSHRLTAPGTKLHRRRRSIVCSRRMGHSRRPSTCGVWTRTGSSHRGPCSAASAAD